MGEDLKRFNHLASEIEAVYHEAALKFGLSDSAMTILYTVCTYGERCPLRTVAHQSGISRQTLNSALRGLEKSGIVYLEPAQRGRKTVCLTDSGKALAEKTVLQLIQIEDAIFASWTRKERQMYLELTRRYLTAFREKVQNIPPENAVE